MNQTFSEIFATFLSQSPRYLFQTFSDPPLLYSTVLPLSLNVQWHKIVWKTLIYAQGKITPFSRVRSLRRVFLIAQSVKNLPAMQETWVRFLGREDPLEEEMATHSNILTGESHGQRSLAGYSHWNCKSQTRLSD